MAREPLKGSFAMLYNSL